MKTNQYIEHRVLCGLSNFMMEEKDITNARRYGQPTTSRTDPHVGKVTEMMRSD
jgi:hypothetical protein